MKIGCVKEIKNNEYRVGLTPDNVKAYVAAGHHVYMEKGAGVGSGGRRTRTFIFSGSSAVSAKPCSENDHARHTAAISAASRFLIIFHLPLVIIAGRECKACQIMRGNSR